MLKQRVGKGVGLQLDMSSAATLKFDHGKTFTQGCSIFACVIFHMYNDSHSYLLRFL